MNQFSIASIRYRVLALGINLATGAFPLILPRYMYDYAATNGHWMGLDSFLDLSTIVLGLSQLILVHNLNGSPGAVFAGLAVRYNDGKVLEFRTSLVRATPYLMVLLASILMPRKMSDVAQLPFIEGASWIYVCSAVFIISSGVVFLVTGKYSLMDRITGTVTVKLYNINPTNNLIG